MALVKILVTSAWPYINYLPHLGTLLPILSADVIARYHRLKGNDVVFVSGSDEHGTPIEVEAIRQGMKPKELADKNHKIYVDLLKRCGISFDNYTRTESSVHKHFVQEHHLKIFRKGYIFTQDTDLPYCGECDRFLPDRFVNGTCPHCKYEDARGDQCDRCGRLLDPNELSDLHCAICEGQPVIKKVKHFFFNMPKFADKLLQYIKSNSNLRANARNFSLRLLEEGLKSRPITRDTIWGIPAPFEEADNKTIYGWFENVLGYISASIEYFQSIGEPNRWKEFWFNNEAKTLFFIGKDNIPFHTIILPALLLAVNEGYNLPWNVSVNEFLTFQGQDFSKSRKIGIWLDEALDMFPADYWRYTLISVRPEARDTNFTWRMFLEKVNSDLNDTLGNFIHRTLTFVNRWFSSKVPQAEKLNKTDKILLSNIEKEVKMIAINLEKFSLQAATRHLAALARLGNKYLNDEQPWKTCRKEPLLAANTIYVATQIVKALSIVMEPFTPFSSNRIREILNLPKNPNVKWTDALVRIPSGHEIRQAKPIFHKIQKSEEEIKIMLEKQRRIKDMVSFQDFQKIDLRVGRIMEVESISGSKNLIKLTIDVGENQPRIAVARIAKHYKETQLINQQVIIVNNLEPKKVFGVESDIMVLSAENDNIISLLKPEKPIKTGSRVK